MAQDLHSRLELMLGLTMYYRHNENPGATSKSETIKRKGININININTTSYVSYELVPLTGTL